MNIVKSPVALATPVVEILTAQEHADLERHEALISKHFVAFETAGRALLAIKDGRLYRGDFATFEDYCRERWQIGRSHAYRLMEASEVVREVPEVENERQAREIAKFEKQIQAQVFKIASATAPGGEITADHIRGVGEVLTDLLKEDGLDDGSGEIKPIAYLLKANINEVVFERMKRQELAITEKRDKRRKDAHTNGDIKGIPAQPISHAMFWLLRDLIHGIETMNADRQVKMHPALHNGYHMGKALLGETTTEVRIMVDEVYVDGACDKCPSRALPVQEVVITTTLGKVESSRMKMCGVCLEIYIQIAASTDAEVL